MFYPKYYLEFDDVIEGQFNDYRLEIQKHSGLYQNFTRDYDDWILSSPLTITGNQLSATGISGTFPLINVARLTGLSLKQINFTTPFYQSQVLETVGVTVSANITVALQMYKAGVAVGTALSFNNVTDSSGTTTDNFIAGDDYELRVDISAISASNDSFSISQLSFLPATETSDVNSIELQGTGKPVTAKYNVTKDNILAPIRSSNLNINFYQMNDSDDYTELLIPENKDFKVKLFRGDIIEWQGFLSPENVNIPQSSAPFQIGLTARDGFHLLKGKLYFNEPDVYRINATAKDIFGYEYIQYIIEKCLYETGNRSEWYWMLPIRNDDNDFGYSELYKSLKIYHSTFLKKESDSMDMQEVLKMILSGLGATIYLRKGKWCIVRVASLTQQQFTSTKLSAWSGEEASGTYNKTTVDASGIDASASYSDTVTFSQIDGGNSTNMMLQYPVKRVIINQKHDHNWVVPISLDSIISTEASSGGFAEWDASGAVETIVLKDGTAGSYNLASRPTLKCFIECGLDASTSENNATDPALYYPQSFDIIQRNPSDNSFRGVYVEADVRPLSPLQLIEKERLGVQFSPRLTVDDGSTQDLILSGLGAVNSDEASGRWIATFDGLGFDPFYFIKDKGSQFFSAKVYSGSLSTSGGSRLRHQFWLYGAWKYIDSDGNTLSTPYANYYDVSYTKVKCINLISQWGIVPKNQQYIVESSADYSFEKDQKIQIGSNYVTGGANGMIIVISDTSYYSWNDFTDSLFSSQTLQHLVATGLMSMYYKPIRRMDGSHYGLYSYGDLMNYDSGVNGTQGKFFPMGVTIDYRNARVKFSGDDLIDNSSLNTSQFTSKIIWEGEADETFTETFS